MARESDRIETNCTDNRPSLGRIDCRCRIVSIRSDSRATLREHQKAVKEITVPPSVAEIEDAFLKTPPPKPVGTLTSLYTHSSYGQATSGPKDKLCHLGVVLGPPGSVRGASGAPNGPPRTPNDFGGPRTTPRWQRWSLGPHSAPCLFSWEGFVVFPIGRPVCVVVVKRKTHQE
jgi:hypothetical protein